MADVEQPPVSVAVVRLLGGVDVVTADGDTIEIPSATQRRLLAVLALEAPRRLRGEWLAELLGLSPGALRRTMARLRVTIGPEAVVTTPTGYALTCDVDAHRFVRDIAAVDVSTSSTASTVALGSALARWGGPPLEEFDAEDWARGEVLRLNELHAGATDDYAEALIRGRRAVEALAILEPHVERHPDRDRSWGLLIRALALAGRQAEALRGFHRYRRLMAEAAGTEPSPEVVRIERRIATGWNGLDDAPSAAPVRDPAGDVALHIPLPRTLSQSAPASGRGPLRQMLRDEVDLLGSGTRRSVVLVGETGIGRTTLLADLARSVTSAGTGVVLYGQCRDNVAPLEPFRSMLTSCVENLPLPLLMEHVARCGGELVRLCPRLAERVRTTPDPTSTDDATARHLVFGAAADLLRRVAEQAPLVVLVDDLHRAQPTALRLLRHLAAELAESPILLVGTLRRSHATTSEELRSTLVELTGHDGRFVEVAGLDEHELAELVLDAGGDLEEPTATERARVLFAQTAGNPLFASQLLQCWATEHGDDADTRNATAELPLGLREVVLDRVRALGDDTHAALLAAAVLGTEFDEAVLLDTAELDHDVVLRSLDAATTDGLLVPIHPARRRMRFVHALVATALTSPTGRADLARIHERAARALQLHLAPDDPRLAVEMAHHTLLAGDPVEAARWEVLAGDQASAGLAPAEAARHYDAALQVIASAALPETMRVDVLVRLGEARLGCGHPGALDTLTSAADAARRIGDDAALIRVALAADRGFIRVDDRAPELRGIVEAALRVLDDDDVATRAVLLALVAQNLVFTPELKRRIDIAHEAWALASRTQDPLLVARVGPAVLSALWTPGRVRERTSIATATVAAAESSGDPRLRFAAHLATFDVAVEAAQAGMAARSLSRLRATARSIGEPRLRWITALCDTFDATMGGRLDDAAASADESLALGTRIGAPDAFTLFAAQHFVLGTFAGRHAELAPLVEQAMQDNPGALPFTLAHGIVCASVGRIDDARRILHRGRREGFDAVAVDNLWMTSIIGYSVLAIELADAAAAAQLLPLIAPHVGSVAFNGVTSQGPVAAYAGKLCSLLGRHDEAEEHLETALGIAMDFGWPYHRATTLHALAEDRWRRDGKLDDAAREWLREAAQLCREGAFRSWLPPIECLLDLDRAQGDRTEQVSPRRRPSAAG